MFTRILRRCAPLLGAASLAAAVFFFWEAARATPVFSYGGYQTNPPNGDYLLADVALLPTDTALPPYPPPAPTDPGEPPYPPYPPPPTEPPPYPPPLTDTVVPPTSTPIVPPTATRVVPPTATRVVPPTSTRVVPPTATRVVPPTATRVVPPTATPVVPPTATRVVPPTATRVAPPTATPLVQPSATPPCSRNPRKYVVQRGDTLYRIAHRFNTTVFGLQRLNRLWGIWIRPGQKLTIPGGCSPTVLPKPTNDVSERHKGDDQRNPAPTESHSGDDQSKTAQTDNQSGSQWSDTQHRIYYTVKAGDNLFRIGLRYSVSVAALQATNGLRSTYITVGQVLLIP